MQTNTQWETLTKNFTLESLVTLYLYRNHLCWHFLYRFQTDRMYTTTSQWCLFVHLFKKHVLVTQQHTKKMYKLYTYFRYLEAFSGNNHLRVKYGYGFRAENSSSKNNFVRWCMNPYDPDFLLNPDEDPGFLVNSDQDPGFLVNRDPDTDLLWPKIR
jgi:hypothetical protein